MKNTNCKWLPETVSLNDYNGDFEAYFKYLYKVFDNDLIKNPPLFKGEKVKARWTPMHENKPEAFYHPSLTVEKVKSARKPLFKV